MTAGKQSAKKSRKKASIKREGTLVVIGGHEDKEGECLILQEVAALVGKGHLVVSTVASEEPAGYFEAYQKCFRGLGVTKVTEIYVKDRNQSMDEAKLTALDGASGVFFTGGDQLRISSQIGDTVFEAKVREVYKNGGVIAGTSAGASALAESMLVRGRSGESYKIGDLNMAPGLGYIAGVIIDQHFAERGRIGRLLGAISINPRIIGIGIDEDTAIVVRGKKFRVVGRGAVYIVDGSAVTASNITEAAPQEALSICGVSLHVLSHGDTFDLETRKPAIHQD